MEKIQASLGERSATSSTVLLPANSMFAIPGQGPLPALQVLYPDPAGLWPWQEGSGAADEPVLGPVPVVETGNATRENSDRPEHGR